MDPIRKILKKVTKMFVNRVINRQYFHRKTGLKPMQPDYSISISHKTVRVLKCVHNFEVLLSMGEAVMRQRRVLVSQDRN